jgi:hypothetical protein
VGGGRGGGRSPCGGCAWTCGRARSRPSARMLLGHGSRVVGPAAGARPAVDHHGRARCVGPAVGSPRNRVTPIALQEAALVQRRQGIERAQRLGSRGRRLGLAGGLYDRGRGRCAGDEPSCGGCALPPEGAEGSGAPLPQAARPREGHAARGAHAAVCCGRARAALAHPPAQRRRVEQGQHQPCAGHASVVGRIEARARVDAPQRPPAPAQCTPCPGYAEAPTHAC